MGARGRGRREGIPPFPPDARLAEPGDLRRAWGAPLLRSRLGAVVELPAYEHAEALLRWYYRRWLHEAPAGGPLALLRAPGTEALWASLEAAQGGWVGLAGPLEDPVAARALAEASGVLLITWTGAPRPLDPAFARALLGQDRRHRVEVDPALDAPRRALEAHARAGSTVLVEGPPGSGRRALLRSLGGAPLAEAGVDRLEPGAWLVWGAHADGDSLSLLRARFRAPAEPRPPPPAGPRPHHPAWAPIVGESPALVAALALADRYAPSPAPVLLLGEPGVGKELFARGLHVRSGRPGPFEALDLGAIPEELLESELFGHVRGAFTGASAERPGAFRRAERGTLFLDELGNLPLGAQTRLLRVLQEHEVRPVGGERAVAVDVRIVAATNADLDAMVLAGRFRRDLRDRLQVLSVRIPPLRERGEDALLLGERVYRTAGGRARPWATPGGSTALLAAAWPGNVRELAGVLTAAATGAPDAPVSAASLGPLGQPRPPAFVLGRDVLDRAGIGAVPLPTVQLPALTSRPPHVLARLVWDHLGGEAVDAEALAALVAAPWPGGFSELEAVASALRATAAAEQRPARAADVTALLGSRPSGLVVVLPGTGLRRELGPEALVLGRARGWEDVPPSRRPWLQARGPLAFLPLGDDPALSRAHVLVHRDGTAVVVERVPGGEGGVLAWSARASAWAPLPPVAARHERGVALQVGGVVVHVHASLADASLSASLPSPEPDPLPATRGEGDEVRLWSLSPEERGLLVELLVAVPTVPFAAWLRTGLTEGDHPARVRLAAWLLRGRPAQYLARLLEHPGNRALLAELRAALARHPDPSAVRRAWPRQIDRVVTG